MPTNDTKIEDAVNNIVLKPLVEAALKKLFAAFPVLAVGPIGWFINWVVMKYAVILMGEINGAIHMQRIVLKNKKLHSFYADSQFKLHVIAKQKGIEAEEFKNAENIYATNFANLITIDL